MRCAGLRFCFVPIIPLLMCPWIYAGTQTGEAAHESTDARVAILWRDAAAAQQAQDYTRAETLYQQILSLEPNLLEAEVNLGLMYQVTGDLQSAIRSFKQALTKAPDLYAANLMTGLDYLKLDSPKLAFPYLERAVTAKPHESKARVGLANSYLQLRKYPEAKKNFEQAIETDAQNSDAWYGLAATYLSMEKEAEGRIAHSAPALASALLGETYLQQGRAAKARKVLQSVAERFPEAPCIRTLLGFALLRDGKLDGAATQFDEDWNLQQGGCLLAKLGAAALDASHGNAEGALRELREATLIDAQFVTSNTEFFWNDFAKAGLEAGAEEILAPRDSTNTVRSSNEANRSPESSFRAGDYSACSAALTARSAPLAAEHLRLLARCSYYVGRDDRAVNATDLLLKMHPDDGEALYWRIEATGRLGLAALSKATDLNPDSASLHVLSGDMLRGKGDFVEAEKEYRKAIALKPDFLAAHMGLARELYSDDDRDGAEKELRVVLDANANDPEANYLMGEILVARKQFAEALPFLQQGLHAAPEELPHVHASLSKVYADRGDVTRAIAELKLAIPGDADGSYHYRLGRLYLQIGNRAASEEAMKQSAKLHRESDAAVSLEDEE
jgi:tetratricopeptide (TPR) repeat protein